MRGGKYSDRTVLRKKTMREYASSVLWHHLVRCPVAKYHILEAFMVSDAFYGQPVRASYLKELLEAMNLGIYTVAIEEELLLNEERVLQLSMVAIPEAVTGTLSSFILMATSHYVYQLSIPGGVPAYHNPSHASNQRWSPAWEGTNPRMPGIVWKKPYSFVHRIYKGFDNQFLGIVWKEGSQISTFTTIFQSSNDCDAFAECLHISSGSEGKRAPMLIDFRLLEECDTKICHNERLLTASWAERVIGVDKTRRAFFVLTEKTISEVSCQFSLWKAPESYPVEAMPLIKTRKLVALLGEDSEDELDGSVWDRLNLEREELIQQHHERTESGHMAGMRSVRETSSLLGEVGSWTSSSIQSIDFDADDAILKIDFGGEDVTIKFYDDVAREAWRRGLAYILAQSDKKFKNTWKS